MNNEFEFLVYHSVQEDVSVNAVIKDETVWLTQKAMAEWFGVQTPAISKHLKNILEEGELNEKVVVSKREITTAHGAIAGKTKTNDANFTMNDGGGSFEHPEFCQRGIPLARL